MGLNYSKLSEIALRLIEDNGKAFTLRKVTGGTFSPTTNAISGATTTNYTVNGVLMNINKRDVDGQNVKREDRILMVAANGLAVAIQEKDVILEGSVEWNVINVEELRPADTVIYYNVQVRQ